MLCQTFITPFNPSFWKLLLDVQIVPVSGARMSKTSYTLLWDAQNIIPSLILKKENSLNGKIPIKKKKENLKYNICDGGS